jgi:hypothetical protein
MLLGLFTSGIQALVFCYALRDLHGGSLEDHLTFSIFNFALSYKAGKFCKSK